jgi:hypothetical protein
MTETEKSVSDPNTGMGEGDALSTEEQFYRLTGRRLRDVGGTKGGIFEFLIGAGLALFGVYMAMERIVVYSHFGGWFGGSTFGLTLVPLMIGIGLLFRDARSILGWVLAAIGVVIIFASVILSLSISFRPTSLFGTIMIFGSIAAGLGLVARALQEHR